jgi:nitrite reductase/ring-hydroxylating ferredoxin subunit
MQRETLDGPRDKVKSLIRMPNKPRHRAPLSNAHTGRSRTRRHRKDLRYLIGRSSDLGPGESMKFLIPIRGYDEECFVVNYDGHLYAYVNRCRHVPMAMDWIDNQFFAEEGHYLTCPTHNAYYDPATGECVAGPPSTCGKFLYRVPLEIEEGVIYVRPPAQEFEDD